MPFPIHHWLPWINEQPEKSINDLFSNRAFVVDVTSFEPAHSEKLSLDLQGERSSNQVIDSFPSIISFSIPCFYQAQHKQCFCQVKRDLAVFLAV